MDVQNNNGPTKEDKMDEHRERPSAKNEERKKGRYEDIKVR